MKKLFALGIISCLIITSCGPNKELVAAQKELKDTKDLLNTAIPYKHITQDHILFDLIYNPIQTKFLEKGFQAKAQTINGLRMLELQAEKSWEIWNK